MPIPVPEYKTIEQEQIKEGNKKKIKENKLQLYQAQNQKNKDLIIKMKTKIECYRIQR